MICKQFEIVKKTFFLSDSGNDRVSLFKIEAVHLNLNCHNTKMFSNNYNNTYLYYHIFVFNSMEI